MKISAAPFILFGPFPGLFFNLAMRIRALFPNSATTLGQSFWRMPLCTECNCASSFEVVLAGPSRHSTNGTLASGTSGSRRVSLILLHERTRRRIQLCPFCTFVDIVPETAIVSFRALPVGLPLPTISQSPFSTLLILDYGACLKISHFWPENSSFPNSARYFFSPLSSMYDNQVLLSSGESPFCTIPIRC